MTRRQQRTEPACLAFWFLTAALFAGLFGAYYVRAQRGEDEEHKETESFLFSINGIGIGRVDSTVENADFMVTVRA